MSEPSEGVIATPGRTFRALFEGVCRVCREDIHVGDLIKRAGDRYIHQDCEWAPPPDWP